MKCADATKRFVLTKDISAVATAAFKTHDGLPYLVRDDHIRGKESIDTSQWHVIVILVPRC